MTPTDMINDILPAFAYEHLPEHLQAISKPFCELAREHAAKSPHSMQLYMGLVKLMEAKDAIVRANLPRKKP